MATLWWSTPSISTGRRASIRLAIRTATSCTWWSVSRGRISATSPTKSRSMTRCITASLGRTRAHSRCGRIGRSWSTPAKKTTRISSSTHHGGAQPGQIVGLSDGYGSELRGAGRPGSEFRLQDFHGYAIALHAKGTALDVECQRHYTMQKGRPLDSDPDFGGGLQRVLAMNENPSA